MKEMELRKHASCTICQRKLGEVGSPLFWVLTIKRFVLDGRALRRQEGLRMMFGGHAGLAAVMGPDEHLAQEIPGPLKVTVCDECAMKPVTVAALSEEGA